MLSTILQGTCGWSDETLFRSRKFYPSSVKTSEDRLRHYALHFPCVEVDTSHYAMPGDVDKWIKATPKGFTFHFKIFQLFSSMSVPFGALPKTVRDTMPERDPNQLIRYAEFVDDVRDAIWERFNTILAPVHQAGKLGVVLFQFQNNHKPTSEHLEYLRTARRKLRGEYKMAIEFRDRSWFAADAIDTTVALLSELDIGLVAVDELEHELYNREVSSQGEKIMPIQIYLPHEDFLYVRIHRRVGDQRVLPQDQIDQWATRLKEVMPKLHGPVYFMWGTDHEDQPMKNMANLAKALGPLVYDWRKDITSRKGSLGSMFASAAKKDDAITTDADQNPSGDTVADESKSDNSGSPVLVRSAQAPSSSSSPLSSPSSVTKQKQPRSLSSSPQQQKKQKVTGSIESFFQKK